MVETGGVKRVYRWTEKKEGFSRVWRAHPPKSWNSGVCKLISDNTDRGFSDAWYMLTALRQDPFIIMDLLAVQNASIGRIEGTLCDHTFGKPILFQWLKDGAMVAEVILRPGDE